MNRILTVAGSDSCGGAGVQADIKTASALGTGAACVITALTAQSADAVYAVLETPPEMVAGQLDAVFSLLRPGAVKIGMVPTAAAAAVIAGKLAEYGAKNIVLDPLSAATAGTRLASEEAAAEAGCSPPICPRRRLWPSGWGCASRPTGRGRRGPPTCWPNATAARCWSRADTPKPARTICCGRRRA